MAAILSRGRWSAGPVIRDTYTVITSCACRCPSTCIFLLTVPSHHHVQCRRKSWIYSIKISPAVNDWERVSTDDNMDRRDLAKSRGTLSGSIWFLCRHAWRLLKLPGCERAQEYRHKYSLNRSLNTYIISVPFSPRQVLYNNQALVRKSALSKVTFPVLLKLISCVYVFQTDRMKNPRK